MSFLLFCMGGYIGISLFVIADQSNYIKSLEDRENKKVENNENIRT